MRGQRRRRAGETGRAALPDEPGVYKRLESQLDLVGEARVAGVHPATRSDLAGNGDPTFLSYVYSGDPEFKFTRAAAPKKKELKSSGGAPESRG